jgi:hypothetical protein
MTYKDFLTGAVFTSADADLLMRQGIIVVANAAARDAIPSPTEGMRVYRLDIHGTETYSGSAWIGLHVTPAPPVPTAGWGLFLNHPGGVPTGVPDVTRSGGFVALRMTLQNTSGGPVGVGGGTTVCNGLPLPKFGDFSLEVHSTNASSPGPVLTDLAAYINNGGGIGLRGPRNISTNELFEIVGMYPVN